MRNCSTCFPHSTPLNSGVPQTRSDENLASVEQVLGVLIDSRFGPNHPYTRLGEQHETTGHSQTFANVTLLSVAEIDAHLNFAEADQLPFYLRPSLRRTRENHRRQRVVVHGGDLPLISEDERSSEILARVLQALRPPAHAGGSPARRSPTFLGRKPYSESPSLGFSERREKRP